VPVRQSLVLREKPIGLIARVREALRSITLGPWNSKDKTLARYFSDGRPAAAGIPINEDSAFNYAAFWQGVSLIAGHMAAFPLIHYKRLKGGGKERYTDSAIYGMLHDQFNPEMSSFVGREVMQAHVLSWGNGYAEIEFNALNKPVNLWPITPDRVTPFRGDRTTPSLVPGAVYYRVQNGEAPDAVLPAARMLHVPGFGFDGLQGYGVVRRARESLSLSLAAERFGATFFGNGSSFGGVFTTDAELDDEAEKKFRKTMTDLHQGPDRAHKLAVLWGGKWTYEKLGVPPDDAQFLETRKFQIEEVARWLNLPPHKLKHLDRSTNNNIEHQGIEYHTDTIWPWQVRWEQEYNRKLIPRLERGQQFIEHLVDGIQRGDIQTRYAAYAVGRQWGWLCADDIRERENMNPLPNGTGQTFLVPLNMTPANRLDDVIDAQVDKAAAPGSPKKDSGLEDVSAANDRAAAAEAAAAAALAVAEEERTKRLIAEATGAATVEELALRRDSETKALNQAEALTLLAREVRQEADRLIAMQAETQARVEAEVAARVLAEQRAVGFEEQAQRLETIRESLTAELQTAVEREAKTYSDMEAAVARATDADARIALTDQENAEKEAARVAAEAEAHRAIEAMDHAKADLARVEQASADAEQAAILAREMADRVLAETRSKAAANEVVWRGKVGEIEFEKARAEQAEQDAATREQALGGDLAETRARLAEVETARAEMEATLKAQKQAEIAKLTNVIAAHRALIVDAMGRMIRRETDRIRKAQGTPEKLRAWIDSFYAMHRDICEVTLLPAVRTHLAWKGSDRRPEDVTRELVAAHIEDSIRQLRQIADSDDYAAFLAQTLHWWEADRANQLADTILREEIDYVRSL
jgi:HK97 family phage portal protein